MGRKKEKAPAGGAFGKGPKPEPKPAPPTSAVVTTAETTPTPPASQPASEKFGSMTELREAAGLPKLPPPAPTGRKAAKPSGDTRAGSREYEAFFGLYAQSLAGSGLEFWPLGFIPGPALLTYGGQEVVAATPDVARRIGALPRSVADLPDEVLNAMQSWADLANALGYTPSSWAEGSAKRLLSGRKPDGVVVLGMTRFRYRGGDAEVAFGVVLESTQDGLRIARVYNPKAVADCPAEGNVLSISVLKDGRGPLQKLVRTHALMESNFSSRYHRDGNPREDR